jgi:hypothetical protein
MEKAAIKNQKSMKAIFLKRSIYFSRYFLRIAKGSHVGLPFGKRFRKRLILKKPTPTADGYSYSSLSLA